MVFNPAPIASLTGGLGLGGDGNWDRFRRYREAGFKSLAFLERLDPGYFAKARQELLGSLAELERGYGQASQALTGVAASSRQAATDRATELTGAIKSGLVSRGLGSTTVGANLQRGVGADLSRTLTGIESGLAGGLSQLALQRGQARAGVQQQLSGLTLAEQASRQSLGDRRIQFLQTLMGFQPTGNAGTVGAAAGTAASFLPFGGSSQKQGGDLSSMLPLLLALS